MMRSSVRVRAVKPWMLSKIDFVSAIQLFIGTSRPLQKAKRAGANRISSPAKPRGPGSVLSHFVAAGKTDLNAT